MAKKQQPSAAQAATAAATAPAEPQGNLPAGSIDNAAPASATVPASTSQPVSEAAALEGGETGQDAQLIVVWNGQGVGSYIEALRAGGVDVIQLKDLAEPLLRHVGQFVEIDGYDVLSPEQLIPLIEAKAGIEVPKITGPAGGYADGDSYRQADIPLPAAGKVTDATEDLELGDGEVEGLWIRAVPEQGLRRCGMRFTREGSGVALSALTDDQVVALISDPNLTVEHGVFSGLVE